MSLQRNYYEVLGIPQGATTDQIKKKYRELARQFHPDVVKDKNHGQRVFSQINQAYRVLGDAERRAQYNSTLATAAANGTSNGTSNGTAHTQTASAQPTPRPQNGTNGTAPQTRPANVSGQTGTAQKTQAITGLLGNADNAIMAGKPVEARAFCVKVLEIDPKHVRALEILGDALGQMGQREEAAVQYRKALQVTPSHSIQAKLTRIEQAGPSNRTVLPSRTPMPSAARPAPPAPARPTAPVAAVADKATGLFGRLLGRK
jgi:curved DNA-binding protein CbpA